MNLSIVQEGRISVTGGEIGYRIAGKGAGTPLITLHGGPGWPSDSLEPLAALGDERPVVLYDQLGCGRSDRPDDVSLWVIERFVEELEQLRAALGYEKINILGHSWGTMLAMDYTLAYPDRVEKLILASPAISASRWAADTHRLCQELPADARDVLFRHEAGEGVDDDAFSVAYKEFMKRHFCRITPTPEPMQRASQQFGGIVYSTMWGASELSVGGNLAGYERAERLNEITCPVLYTCGRYDEAAPESAEYFKSLTPNAQLVIFENSAHVAFHEEEDAYIETVRAFLR